MNKLWKPGRRPKARKEVDSVDTYWDTFIKHANEKGYTRKVTGTNALMNEDGQVIKLISTFSGSVRVYEEKTKKEYDIYRKVT